MKHRSLAIVLFASLLALGAWADKLRRIVSNPAPARI